MSTATKKKKPSGKASPAKAVQKSHGLVVLRTEQVSVASIDPNPFQPRAEFDEAEIEALGKALQEQGQLTPLTLREVDGRYQSLDGGRRVLAARKADILSLRAEICEASDAQARAITLATVLHRTDLSSIEQARAFEMAIQAGDATGPTELAESLGIDQSTVSNRLRLLELPDFWQAALISREITERHARAVLRWLDYPAVMDDLEHAVVRARGNEEGELCPTYQWENEVIPAAVRNNSRSLSGVHGDRTYYDSKLGQLTIFEPNAMQIKPLDIVTLDEEERAMNVALFDALQSQHVEEILAERERTAEAAKLLGDGEQGAGSRESEEEDAGVADEDGDLSRTDVSDEHAGDSRKREAEIMIANLDDLLEAHCSGKITSLNLKDVHYLENVLREGVLGILDDNSFRTACLFYRKHTAEQESLSDSSHTAEPSRADPGDNALRRWMLAWAQWLIADEIRQRTDSNTLLGMLMLGMHTWGFEVNEQELDEVCADKLEPNRKKTLSERILMADVYHLEQVAGVLVANWFFIEDRGPMFLLDGEEIKRIIDAMAIDMEGEFQAGNVLTPLALLNLLDEAGLHALGKAWKVEMPATIKRAKLIELLASAINDGRTMPAELKAAWKQIGKKSA